MKPTTLTLFLLVAVNHRAFADAFGSGANTFNIDYVTIGSPGNAADTTGDPNPAGSIPYTFRGTTIARSSMDDR